MFGLLGNRNSRLHPNKISTYLFVCDDFWRHVSGRAADGRLLADLPDPLREAEVGHEHLALLGVVVVQQVLQFEVPCKFTMNEAK